MQKFSRSFSLRLRKLCNDLAHDRHFGGVIIYGIGYSHFVSCIVVENGGIKNDHQGLEAECVKIIIKRL